jgi:hypothetical protein
MYIAAALEAFGNILSASFVENNVLPKFARVPAILTFALMIVGINIR